MEDALPQQVCDEILQHFKLSAPRPRSYQGIVDEALRNCEFAEVPGDLAGTVTQQTAGLVEDYFGVATQPMDGQPQVVYRYGEGVGFVTHHDEVTEIELQRARSNGQPVLGGDITTILFLNSAEDYSGGALYFEDPQLEFRPRKGTFVAFPATRKFLHGVRPVLIGERYTLLARLAVAV
ncbi:2OG-Fe(II) oxygenase [Streptomyces sp. H10-C2]|uniref:2OG-Fe(II) oxygenase n=1 Tax=unclassified Streptomyces TaxID=2593676 RepID=UPI0024B9DBD0|nr:MULTISPECIES: 2OG-Fe(II) oxygenase [unclassified Streptomyces]MDJ0346295.1 2OG-Fe(II) oxygenase [Streptomyces sp. PH10-H1]MDJ0374904.1 2OG-Fe(II) oxygenase [Streptomyces sp. H10-C2]